MEKLLFSNVTANMIRPRAIPATGTITTIAAASLVDGETFTLHDANRPWVYELDTNGVIVSDTPGRVRVDISGGLSADGVRDAIIAAVNLTNSDLIATNNGAASVALRNKRPGVRGNQRSLETVANAGFILTDLTGGLIDGVAVEDLSAFKDWMFWIQASAGSVAMTGRFRVWGWRETIYQTDSRTPPDAERGWVIGPLGNGGTDPNRGYLNAGVAIAEDAVIADRIYFTQSVADLAGFAFVYLQLTDVGGTGTAFTAGVYADPPWQRRA